MLGRKYVCGMSGVSGFSYVEDVARIFLGCSRAKVEGAPCHNIRGDVTTAEEYMRIGTKGLSLGKLKQRQVHGV